MLIRSSAARPSTFSAPDEGSVFAFLRMTTDALPVTGEFDVVEAGLVRQVVRCALQRRQRRR
jgi:hypothetical protein